MVRGYFPVKQFCGIFPIKKLWAQNDDLKFQRCHINFSGVIDPAEIVSAGSMALQKSFQGGYGPRCNSNIVDFFGEY
jgi:hypothetical protein